MRSAMQAGTTCARPSSIQPPVSRSRSVEAYLRRDPETNAAVSASGIIVFDDGSTTTWNCGFESGAGIMDLRISGAKGVIKLDDFPVQAPLGPACRLRIPPGLARYDNSSRYPADKPEAALMFEDFCGHGRRRRAARRQAARQASERTQQWLDAIWDSALSNESRC